MESVVSSGITPLEVLLTTMREHWEKGEKAAACAVAKDAAPYIHARLLSSESRTDVTVSYVARMPEAPETDEAWREKYAPAATLQ